MLDPALTYLGGGLGGGDGGDGGGLGGGGGTYPAEKENTYARVSLNRLIVRRNPRPWRPSVFPD